MRRLRVPILLSIVLFLALTLGGTYFVRKGILERALANAITVGDARTIESLLNSWPCPLDARGDQGSDLLLWAEDQDEFEVARLCIEKGVAPVDPSLFPLGGGVYQEGDRDSATRQVLAFMRQPRWFVEKPRRGTKTEHDAWLKAFNRRYPYLDVVSRSGNEFYIPGPSTHPHDPMSLPFEDRGVTLTLAVAPTDNASVLRFELTLASRSREIEREVKHRWTNLVPFLFALYADGRPVTRSLNLLQKEGGVEWKTPLVPAGGSRTWSLAVDTGSLRSVLPRSAREVTVVAAFSDSRHEAYSSDLKLERLSMRLDADNGPNILVRSNAATFALDRNRATPSVP